MDLRSPGRGVRPVIIFDTNVISELIRATPDPGVRAWVNIGRPVLVSGLPCRRRLFPVVSRSRAEPVPTPAYRPVPFHALITGFS